MPAFPPGFPQTSLWVDPLQPNPGTYFGAVLRAEEINEYVQTHNLLIDRTDFRPKNLKGASYTMSPHATEAWIIPDRGVLVDTLSQTPFWLGDAHEPLSRRRNSRGEYYAVPANSLVYIRLREVLRLPFYVIGRHNLKIDYVYQGLLLGTGPQVDPGYVGQLYIPLHNLTNREVEIYVEESFVSIDFVRTGPLVLQQGVPATYQDFYRVYKHTKRPIDLDKVDQKTNLDAYLQGTRPSSSLGSLVPRVEKLAWDARRRRWIEVTIVLTALAALVGLYATYFFHFEDKLTKHAQATSEAVEKLQQQTAVVQKSSVPATAKLDETQQRVEELRQELADVKAELHSLQDQMRTPAPPHQ